MVRRQVDFILRATVNVIAKLATVFVPAALFLCPFLESYQLDCLASRCSRKSFNLLKDSERDNGCFIQYAILASFSAFTFLW